MSTRARRVMHDEEGLNSGVWPIQTDHFVTPVDRFFTRSHAAVPRVDPPTWRLEVGGLVERPRTFSFEELRRGFAQQHVTATLVCAGLRREEFLSLGPLPGETPWGPEAASTGRWTGPSLRDVLHAAGVREGARHVEFIGLDQVDRQGRRFGFGGSIDLAKAMSGEVTLATELNGASLPAAHGFPLRAVVPGWIGARSVKWLGRITLLEEPSPNYFQRSAYRFQRAINPQDPRDVTSGTALSGVPLNAVIVDPLPDQVIRAGRVRVRGWAMGSMGRRVSSVELSPDGGCHWIAARLSAEGEDWTWNFWEATVEVAPGTHTLVVRATDSAGTKQPEAVAAAWNVKGYCNNGWHRVAIQVG